MKQLGDVLGTQGGRVAFIGEGNYHSVQHVLPPSQGEGGKWEVVYIPHLEDLEEAVANGTVLAGMVSGEPANADGALTTFSSSTVSPRAALLAHCSTGIDTREATIALNAAVMEVNSNGQFLALQEANAPFQAVAAFTCGVQPGAFPNASTATGVLADIVKSKTLKVAALGPYDWGVDGNYTKAEPTGFWPDYVAAVASELSAGLGIEIAVERAYSASSTGTLQLLLDGEAHISEPYFATNGFFGDLPRQDAFHMSCTTLGYDSTFFTRNQAVLAARASLSQGKDDGDVGGGKGEAIGAGSGLRSLAILRERLESEGGAVAFIGEGNYHSVQHVLPPSKADGGNWEVVYIAHLDEMEAAVANGTVLAGLVSGEPEDVDGVLNTFSSGTISPRAALMADECEGPKGGTLQLNRALSAAIMHVQVRHDVKLRDRGYQHLTTLHALDSCLTSFCPDCQWNAWNPTDTWAGIGISSI